MSHMRKGENSGESLEITLNDTQAKIGTSIPFLQLDPQIYNYGTKNTR